MIGAAATGRTGGAPTSQVLAASAFVAHWASAKVGAWVSLGDLVRVAWTPIFATRWRGGSAVARAVLCLVEQPFTLSAAPCVACISDETGTRWQLRHGLS